MKASLIQIQDQVKEMFETQKEISEAQREISKAQNEMFDAIKNLTADAKTRDEIPQGNIVVGDGGRSVEMYSLANRTWSELAPMQERRKSLTAHFYNGQIMVTGGEYGGSTTNTIEYIQIPEETRLPINRACPDEISLFFSELPIECHGHKTAILNNHLWMVGGHNNTTYLNTIYATPIKSPHTHTVKCEMPKPLAFHSLENS